ncbi:MAG: DUF6440 family protein [Clostridium sp.]|uniref:DUF6440 family protein n=1 Tax=Clostridium sp. TaxID=1506 RepID=UPI003F365ED8
MFGKVKKEKRFVVKEKEDLGIGSIHIIVDTVTGVNYMTTVGVGMSGITPLLDSNGQVIIDK